MISVPISNEPNQSFSITVPVNGQNLTLDFYVFWNAVAGYWEANIAQAGNTLIAGLPLVTASGPPYDDILYQFHYLDIGSAYVYSLGLSDADYPGVGDWGTNFVLLWG